MKPVRCNGTLTAMVAVLLAMLATPGAAAQSEFAQSVDLSPLSRVAVQTEGRLKSFDSFANGVMQFVTGSRQIAGQSPSFTYLDLLLRPQAYDDADVIYVKNKSVRAQIADELRRARPEYADRLEVFTQTGLISERMVLDPALTELLTRLQGDLIRTAKSVNAISTALTVKQPANLMRGLRIIPPVTGDPEERWHGFIEVLPTQAEDGTFRMGGIEGLDPAVEGRLVGAWQDLVTTWTEGNADGASAAIAALASELTAISPGVYPAEQRLALESWYFRWSNMSWTWLVYMLSSILLLMGVVYRWRPAMIGGLSVFAVAFLLQTAAVGIRWYISGRWPNSNMFEAVTTAAWFGGCCAILLEIGLRRTPMRGLFALGSAVASMVALMAAHMLPAQLNPNISNMMPVLHDVWLYIHTNVIIFSYCLIFMAAVSAGLYLAWRLLGGAASYARVGGAGSLIMSSADGSPILQDQRSSWGEVLDGVTMILMEISFVLLWAGIAMGAIWADHSWGRPWGWDPKEVFALNTFLVFAILIHVRLKARDKGLWTAVLAVVGAGVMLFNWIVINFVITGLHSYA